MKLATIKELSEFLKVKEATLYSWVSRGAIPSFKLNSLIRFDMDEIDAWIERSKNKSVELPKQALGKATTRQDVDTIVKKAIDSVKNKARKKK